MKDKQDKPAVCATSAVCLCLIFRQAPLQGMGEVTVIQTAVDMGRRDGNQASGTPYGPKRIKAGMAIAGA